MMDEYTLQFFAYEHLPADLQTVSAPFGTLARRLMECLPGTPQRAIAIQKLLEAKDAAVRTAVAAKAAKAKAAA
jgi:hypothetical protein